MSYLHCPTCQRAYNVATQPACPSCGIRPGTSSDPTQSIVAAADELARAIARATPAELTAAEALLDARSSQLTLPAPGDRSLPAPSILRAVRSALFPTANPNQALLATVAVALLARVVSPAMPSRAARAVRSMTTWSTRARALLARF